MPGVPLFEIHGNIPVGTVIPIGSEKWRPLGVNNTVIGPPKDEVYI